MFGPVPGTKNLGQLGRFECLVSQAVSMSMVVLLWGPRGQPRRRWEDHRPEAAVQISAVCGKTWSGGHRTESDGGVEVSCGQV